MKKHAIYSILAMVSLLGLGITQSARANLVANGGFETGDFTDWSLSGNTGFTGVNGNLPHSGSFSAELGPIGSDGFLTQTLATTAGGHYVLNFWLQNDDPSAPSHFDVQWGSTTLLNVTDPSSSPYTLFTYNVTATGATTTLEFSFQQDPAWFHLDDISVTVPDAGSTLSLLGFASLGLVALRRKLGC